MLKSIVSIFFPKVCENCENQLGDNEQLLCTDCRHSLPITDFHFNNDNMVKTVLYGRAELEEATALLRFEKRGIVQKLMHELKYRSKEDIGLFFGNWLGEELKESKKFNTIDIVIPVPLHKKKLKKRGYNQVTKFGKSIAKILNANFEENVLLKTTNTSSQVNKKRLERWQYDNETFSLINANKISNKHILLVDDIITTGATMEACILELNKAENVKISIATMAIA